MLNGAHIRLFSVSWLLLLLCIVVGATWAQPYKHQQRCSVRLENALEHVRRRSVQLRGTSSTSTSGGVRVEATSRSMSLAQETPYSLYHAFYGQRGEGYDDFYDGGGGGGDGFGGGTGGYRGYFAKRIDHQQLQPQISQRRPYDGLLDSEHFGTAAEMDEDLHGGRRQAHKLSVSRVDVEDLRVKLPPPSKAASRWVEVDKCKFSTVNSTLDTRLIFPDLTISGKVVLQPSGGKCQMILRLRHAGIEFHTTPIGFDVHDGGGGVTGEESRRGIPGAASVRTDSHFAEPGFISVFAHGCQGPTGIRLRQNSKRRYGFGEPQAAAAAVAAVELSEPQVVLGSNAGNRRWGKYDRRQHAPTQHPYYDIRSDAYYRDAMQPDFYRRTSTAAAPAKDDLYEDTHRRRRYKRFAAPPPAEDQMHFNDDILNFTDDALQEAVQPDARAFAEIFSGRGSMESERGRGYANRDDVDEAFTGELERLFSMGVRSLLTTYMQRALQPAIKETLMENMGYTLSYG